MSPAPAAAPPAVGKAAERRRRLNLYVSEGQLRRLKRLQAEAIEADVPLGQRGPSVLMAAALDVLEGLSRAERLAAVRRAL